MKTRLSPGLFSAIATCVLFVSSLSPAAAQVFAERFAELDQNGDGQLDEAEAGERFFFQLADEDKNKLVTTNELKKFLWKRQRQVADRIEEDLGPPLSAKATFEARAESAAAYSKRHGGTSLVILEKGELVFEVYAEGVTAESTFHIHSGTKGFWGVVVAAMIDDGLIASFDEKAAKTLTEWSGDPRRETITLRELLQLNAGLGQDLVNLQGHDRPTLADDLYQHAIGLPIWSKPGTRFAYGPSCYYALGAVLERKLKELEMNPLEYLESRILTPISVEHGKWVHDHSGNPHIPNGAWITARDWARFGQLLLDEGKWNGEEIISTERMRELREPSDPNPGHGLALWLNAKGGMPSAGQPYVPDPEAPGGFIFPDGETDLYAAMGKERNRLYVIPSKGLVIARQAEKDRDSFQDREFLKRVFGIPEPEKEDSES
ncbi:MAG: serine hydrolase [Verrucomicrobiota bacterium]